MAWSLEIHHLDIKSVGDATIIVATDTTSNEKRSVLIDGGKTSAGQIIHTYITHTLLLTKIDVIVVTHYDKDHLTGITWLLQESSSTIYDNAIIYDLGQPNNDMPGYKQQYKKYVAAVSKKPNVHRATEQVNSFNIVEYNKGTGMAIIPRGAVDGFLDPHWLLGKEIMWGNGMDGVLPNPAFASNPPPNATYPSLNPPKITCIAANKYVSQQGVNPTCFVSDVIDELRSMKQPDLKDTENKCTNCKSLAFLVKLNNFKYYIAGDLESLQEDGCNNDNPPTFIPSFQPGV
jgi:hypothetical protein